MLSVAIDPFVIEGANPPVRQMPRTAFGMLLRLDDDNGAGLPENEFRNLFRHCNHCKIYTTKCAFAEHSCSVDAIIHEVIDLTGDD